MKAILVVALCLLAASAHNTSRRNSNAISSLSTSSSSESQSQEGQRSHQRQQQQQRMQRSCARQGSSCSAFSWAKASAQSSQPKNPIPGTNLNTGTFYQISIKGYPDGLITWTNEGYSFYYHYVQLAKQGLSEAVYRPGGAQRQEVLWELIPELEDRETGWYRMRVKGRCGTSLTFNPSMDFDGGEQDKVYYLLIEDQYRVVSGREPSDLLLKPVKTIVGGKIYYQLKFKNYPKGIVTYSVRNYGSDPDNKYLVMNTNPSQAPYFEEGGKWAGDHLFTIVESPN